MNENAEVAIVAMPPSAIEAGLAGIGAKGTAKLADFHEGLADRGEVRVLAAVFGDRGAPVLAGDLRLDVRVWSAVGAGVEPGAGAAVCDVHDVGELRLRQGLDLGAEVTVVEFLAGITPVTEPARGSTQRRRCRRRSWPPRPGSCSGSRHRR